MTLAPLKKDIKDGYMIDEQRELGQSISACESI